MILSYQSSKVKLWNMLVFFSFIIITNKYFSNLSPSNVNVKIVFWTIAKVVDNEWWMNEFNYVNY